MNLVYSGGGGMGYGGMGPGGGPPMPGGGGAQGMQNMAGGSRFPSPGMPPTKQALRGYLQAFFFPFFFY